MTSYIELHVRYLKCESQYLTANGYKLKRCQRADTMATFCTRADGRENAVFKPSAGVNVGLLCLCDMCVASFIRYCCFSQSAATSWIVTLCVAVHGMHVHSDNSALTIADALSVPLETPRVYRAMHIMHYCRTVLLHIIDMHMMLYCLSDRRPSVRPSVTLF